MSTLYSAFKNETLLSMGPLEQTLDAAEAFLNQGGTEPILFFDLSDGSQKDFNLKTMRTEDLENTSSGAVAGPSGRGRPKLGIVSREITLLPRHWEWLENQPGRASGTLRRLVDAAMDASKTDPKTRGRAAVRFLTGVGGHLPGFEEFCRQVNRENWSELGPLLSPWPEGIKQVLEFILKPVD